MSEVASSTANPLSFAITLMEHLVVPTFVLDAQCRVLIWNRACERLTDIPAAELVGTREHWRAFYDGPRPCLADLVATNDFQKIDQLYTVFEDPVEPSFGIHAENWCWMPRRGQRVYLSVDAGPVYDESGRLIAVVETLRDMTEKQLAQSKVIEQADLLRAHFDEHQREAELARRILEHQIRDDLIRQAGVRHIVLPASNFSGDLVLAAVAPNACRYALLADATGHGLAAAVSILPVVQEFYRLVEQAEPLVSMVESINFMLSNSLPLGRFVAAALLCLDDRSGQLSCWVGGMPEGLVVDAAGRLRQRLKSNNLPLGIARDIDLAGGLQTCQLQAGDQIILMSDGVVELANPAGQEFASDGVLQVLANAPVDPLSAISAALQSHAAGVAAHDDMSLLCLAYPAQ